MLDFDNYSRSLNPVKVLHIAGHQRQPVDQRGSGHEGISKGHGPWLTKGHRLIHDGWREGQDSCEAKERFQILSLLGIELVLPKVLHIADHRDGWRIHGLEADGHWLVVLRAWRRWSRRANRAGLAVRAAAFKALAWTANAASACAR
jgi:hypothetical protein